MCCNLVQYWDEFETLAKSFGLYKGGSGGGSFDRSIYLTMYNGEDEFSHTTKSYDCQLLFPRLSIFGAAHPTKIITRFLEEKNLVDCDGLYARFLVFNPEPMSKRIGIKIN